MTEVRRRARGIGPFLVPLLIPCVLRAAAPFGTAIRSVAAEFPGEPGRVEFFPHSTLPVSSNCLALGVQSTQPMLLKVRAGVFDVAPGRGYAVTFSGRPHEFLRADTDGVLTIPLLSRYSYNTVVAAPSDIADLLQEASWQGRADPVAAAIVPPLIADATNAVIPPAPVGAFSRDPSMTRSGRPALRLEKLAWGGEVSFRSPPVRLVRDREYLLSGYYRAPTSEFGASAGFEIHARMRDGSIQRFRQVNLNPPIATSAADPWKYAFLRFTAPTGAVDARAVLWLRGAPGQAMWWDDVALHAAPPVTINVVRELPPADTTPAMSVAEVRSLWAGRASVRVETVAKGGFPVLHVDGRPVASLSYNGYGVAVKESEIKPMLAAGIRWHHIRIKPNAENWWTGGGRYDFAGIRDEIETALRHDSNLVVMLNVRISPRFWAWGDAHPEAVWHDADGDRLAGQKDTVRKLAAPDGARDGGEDVWAHSYSARAFRESAAEALRALAGHLGSFDAGKAVAGIHFWCGTDNQWFGHEAYRGVDYSPGAVDDFRGYLRRIYRGEVSALQRAWGDPLARFETATPARPSLRDRADRSYLDPGEGTDRRVLDTNRHNDLGVAAAADYLGCAVKEAFGRQVFVSMYAPDIFHGYNGRSAHRLLLEGRGIDGLVGVPEYGMWRQPGRTGASSSAWGSPALHNKIVLSELDYRTHTCWVGGDGFHYLYYAHGGVLDEEEFAGQARRDLGALLASGQGAWFLAMNRLLFGTPRYRDIVRELASAAGRAADRPMPQDRGQMAVYVDEDTRNAASLHFGPALNNASIGPGKIALWRSGVTWDSYYLSDLDHPARPAYKVHFFAAAPTLSAAQAAYIRENLQKDGNVLVFAGAAGVASGDAGWLETLRTLSGMRIRCDPATPAVFRVRALPCGDRMAEGLKDNSPTELRHPLIHVDDPDAVAFGEIAGTGKAGWAVRRFGTWTGVFIAVPGSLTPELVRNIVREAGGVPVGPCGDMTTAGNGFLTLHAMSDGEKMLQWTGPCDVDDLIDGTSAGRSIESLRFSMKAGETRWFRKR